MNINCIHPKVIIGGISQTFSKLGSYLGKAWSVVPGNVNITAVASKALSSAIHPATKSQKIARAIVVVGLGAIVLKKMYDYMKNYWASANASGASDSTILSETVESVENTEFKASE